MVIQTQVFSRYFLKNEQRKSLSPQEKQIMAFVDSVKTSFQVETGILENFHLSRGADNLPRTL